MELHSIFDIYNLVLNDIPIEFLSTIVYETLPEAYKKARVITENYYASPEAKVILPYNRRAKAEEYFRDAARKFPELEVSVRKNDARNSFYTQIRSGRIVMTISAVNTPNEFVAAARFRETLAKASFIQRGLFGPTEEELERPLNGVYYAIILHSKVSGDNDDFYFAQLAFPSRNCKSYVQNIDLFKFLDAYAGKRFAAEEHVQDEIIPLLKPSIEKKRVEK